MEWVPMICLISSAFLFFKMDRKLKSDNDTNTDRGMESSNQTPLIEDPIMVGSPGVLLGQRGTSLPIIPRPCWLDTLSSASLFPMVHKERKLRWWKEPWNQEIPKDKFLFPMWLTSGIAFKAGATLSGHDAVDKKVTLNMKGDRDRKDQGMTITIGWLLGL